MEMEKASQLSQAWGKKPCDHPVLEREYHHGAHTGDRVCTQCGESFAPNEPPVSSGQAREIKEGRS